MHRVCRQPHSYWRFMVHKHTLWALAALFSISANAQQATEQTPEIKKAQLPTTEVVAQKDFEKKTLLVEPFPALADLSKLLRYQSLISVPLTPSGSGNVWDSNGNAGINLRGIEGNRIGLEVDGIAMPDAAPKPDATSMQAFAVGRDYFDPEMMQELSVQSGAHANANGSGGGLGGKLMFRSKSPRDFLGARSSTYTGAKLALDTGNVSHLLSMTGAWGNPTLQAMLIGVRRKGEQAKNLGKIEPNPDHWQGSSVLAKFDWALSPTQQLRLGMDAFERESQREFLSRVGPSYPQGVKQTAQTSRQRISVDYDNSLGWDAIEHMTLKAYAQNAAQDDTSLADYVLGGKAYLRRIETAFNNKVQGMSVDAEKRLGKHYVNYGIKFENSSSARPWREDRSVLATGAHQITSKNRMADMDGRSYTAQLSDEIAFDFAGQPARLTPSLRLFHRSLTPKNLHTYVVGVPSAAKELHEDSTRYLNPGLRLQLTHLHSELVALSSYFAFSQNTRPVSAAEKTGTYDSFSYTGAGQGYAILGNPQLKNESGKAFEMGLNAQVDAAVALQGTVYYNRYQDFIEYVIQAPDPVNYPTITYGLYRPENIGKASTWGGEISAQIQFGKYAGSWQGYSAHLAAGVGNGSAENVKTGQRNFLASVAPAKLSMQLAYDDAAKLFGAALAVVHVREKQAANEVIANSTLNAPRFTVPSHSVLDFNGYWSLRKNLKLNVAIYNLSNRKYWDYANSRKLAAVKNAADVAAQAEIERQVMPGRSAVVSLQWHYE